jgi:hypothetical protein
MDVPDAGIVVGLALTTPAKLDLEALVVSLVLDSLEERLMASKEAQLDDERTEFSLQLKGKVLIDRILTIVTVVLPC